MVRSVVRAPLITLVLQLGIAAALGAQVAQEERAPADFELSVASIMQGPELVGTSPSRLRWSPDGKTLYFVWKERAEERAGLYRVGRGGGRPERVSAEEAERVEPQLGATYSDDRRWAAYEDDGVLYLLDVGAMRERVLVSVPGRLSSVQIAPDANAVFFVLDGNVFRVDVETGATVQLTDIRRGNAPREEKDLEGQRKFLKDENWKLLKVFEADSIRRSRAWPPPDPEDADTPKAFYVKNGERFGGYWVSPDGRRMAFSLSTEAKDAKLAWVPDYVAEDGYTRQAPRRRTNVGDEQDTAKMGVIDLVTGDVVWVDHGQGDRGVSLQFRGWSDDSNRLLAVAISDDFHDRWVLVASADSGKSRVLDYLHDEAWVGGPGLGSAGWMPDGRHVWFMSEATGFAHLYTVALGGGEPTPLTTGPWEVHNAWLSEDEKAWYLVTSEAGPHERGFYRMSLDGSDRELVTSAGTLHGAGRFGAPVAVSPDGKRVAALFSWPNHPPELFLLDKKQGARVSQITESTTAEFRSREWMIPDIIYFTAEDGVEVPARLYRPRTPNGAGVIFVHGAGYMQNVHRWWSSYYREYMFHNLLAERGYAVLDIDYRGSAGYGRDWRTAIRRHMGSKDLSDQVDGARFLVDSLGVDPERIGLYGGSYGGFITLMAMFTQPETFAAGAALRPVTDWAYYNHWYTSRILGLPQDDVEAYRISSPIYHAEGLEGALLICHGMIDQNVHFQDTVRLTERLMELGKENWEVAIYPKEDHGFVHPWAWTDEYQRILGLFEENIGAGR
jgi:dipeptidyl aminopeptidase/acylaminoacyl peptidase